MSFSREREMYHKVADHLECLGYETRVDSPEQHGIKFDLLKGWTIDVAGMRKENGKLDVVAVEVKNDLGAQSIVQAISQAEMYKSVCTKVYVAFPGVDINARENKEEVKEICELCQTKGIGVISVGKECREVIPATASPLKVELHQDIVRQFSMTASHFRGFDVDDFAKRYMDEEWECVWHKLELLAKELERRLRPKRLHLTHYARGADWWFSYSRRLKKGERYYHIPHFTLSFRDDGIVMEMITRDKTHLARLRRNIKKNRKLFAKVVMQLKRSKHKYEIGILETVHVKGYYTRTASTYKVNSDYLDAQRLARLVEFLDALSGNKWFLVEHLFHMSREEVGSKNFANDLVEVVNELFPLYELITQK